MSVQVPTFDDSYGLFMRACGPLRGHLGTTMRSLDLGQERVARYRTQSGSAFLRAWLGGKARQHLHVDCAKRAYFRSSLLPKVTHKKAEVLQIIEEVLGTEIDLAIVACFEVPVAALPETGLIRSLAGEQTSTGMSVKLVGCELSLTGAPVTRIGWNMDEGEGEDIVHVRMHARRSTVVSERYLAESWEWICRQLELFVLGRRKDERA